jgi:hypothetical protein
MSESLLNRRSRLHDDKNFTESMQRNSIKSKSKNTVAQTLDVVCGLVNNLEALMEGACRLLV